MGVYLQVEADQIRCSHRCGQLLPCGHGCRAKCGLCMQLTLGKTAGDLNFVLPPVSKNLHGCAPLFTTRKCRHMSSSLMLARLPADHQAC